MIQLAMTLQSKDADIDDWLIRARRGDAGARRALLVWCRGYLHSRVSRRGSELGAVGVRGSDVAQDAVIAVDRNLDEFAGTTAIELKTWLKTIAKNQVLHSLRDEMRAKRDARLRGGMDDTTDVNFMDPNRSPSQTIAEREEWRRLCAQIFDLPEDQKVAMYSHYIKGLPLGEVAVRMNRSEDAVTALLQRGLRNLRRWQEEEFRDSNVRVSNAAVRDAATLAFGVAQRRDSGEVVDVDAIVAEHPRCADIFREMLGWIERLSATKFGGESGR